MCVHRIVVVFALVLFLSPATLPGQEGEIELGKKKTEEKSGEKARELSPDEKYVRENLKRYLAPTKLEFADDGTVMMDFNFKAKSEAHRVIFHRRLGESLKSPFRYTIFEEEVVVGGDPGLRVSNAGVALIKAWFTDDVEAEMHFLQHINHKSSHVAAVVLCNEKGAMIGSNYGSQCASFAKNGRPGRRRGRTQPVVFNQTGKIKLVVKDGVYEAHREGRKKAALKYKADRYESGRVGFVWGGSVSGTITRLIIKGKLDYEKTAKQIKEGLGDA